MAELVLILKSLDVDGVVETSINHTIVEADKDISVTTGATDKTVLFPPLVNNIGREITVYKDDAGVGDVINDGNGSELINGSLTDLLTSEGSSKTYKAFPSGWRIK